MKKIILTAVLAIASFSSFSAAAANSSGCNLFCGDERFCGDEYVQKYACAANRSCSSITVRHRDGTVKEISCNRKAAEPISIETLFQ